MQNYLNNISQWSEDNKSKIYELKSNKIIFSRSQDQLVTRLTMNYTNLEQVHAIKFLGLWLTYDMSFSLNCEKICQKAYKRLLTKLKYVGVKRRDLSDIYKLFIRSCLEYASVVYHSSLTKEQSDMIETVQITLSENIIIWWLYWLSKLIIQMFINYFDWTKI